MKTLTKLLKEETITKIFSDLRAISKDRIYTRHSWLSKIDNISSLDSKKATKILNSKKFKELLLEEIHQEIFDEYNREVANWFVGILDQYKVTNFLWLDVYYSKNLDIDEVDASFNSRYGSHDVTNYKLSFSLNDKVYETEVEKSHIGRGW